MKSGSVRASGIRRLLTLVALAVVVVDSRSAEGLPVNFDKFGRTAPIPTELVSLDLKGTVSAPLGFTPDDPNTPTFKFMQTEFHLFLGPGATSTGTRELFLSTPPLPPGGGVVDIVTGQPLFAIDIVLTTGVRLGLKDVDPLLDFHPNMPTVLDPGKFVFVAQGPCNANVSLPNLGCAPPSGSAESFFGIFFRDPLDLGQPAPPMDLLVDLNGDGNDEFLRLFGGDNPSGATFSAINISADFDVLLVDVDAEVNPFFSVPFSGSLTVEQAVVIPAETQTPSVPEPGTLALLGTALAGLGVLYYRSRSRRRSE